MTKIEVSFPDGNKREFESGITGLEVAQSIGEGLARASLAIKVNGKIQDLSTKIEESSEVQILTFKDPEGVEVFRHSSAHLLAQAVTELYSNAILTIGPVVEGGFYYDIDREPFNEEDVVKIEAKMKEIVERKLEVQRIVMNKEEALKEFSQNPYKVELIKELPDDATITAYKQGDFIDLCEGPHLPNTGMIKAFKITKIAGAYWRGDAKNKQLQRLYGTSFTDKKDLRNYLTQLEEAAKRDHRKIGKDLKLFMFHEWSPGSPFFLPKGTIIYNELLEFIKEEYENRGYDEVITPQLFNKELWETSGHWEHFKDDMFIVNVDDTEFSMKPMNCPSHCLVYQSEARSYRDLPIRMGDFCYLHRNEVRGALGGMTRVRKFSQDDAHIFCTPEQIQEEIKNLLEFVKFVYGDMFKMEYVANLSTKPEKAMGDAKVWETAEKALEESLKSENISYTVKEGEGAFYGPKIDFDVKDAIGRTWQCATIQLDFQMPQRFKLEYADQNSNPQTPVMIHRAMLGSLERFFAVLVEHYAGKFPLWLSPVQVRVLTIADRFNDYAKAVVEDYKEAGVRIEFDDRQESLNKKVRDAQLDQINYILVVGEKEVNDKTVTVRTRDNVVQGARKVDEFLKELLDEIIDRR